MNTAKTLSPGHDWKSSQHSWSDIAFVMLTVVISGQIMFFRMQLGIYGRFRTSVHRRLSSRQGIRDMTVTSTVEGPVRTVTLESAQRSKVGSQLLGA
jgi:hypothetical protein